MSKRAVFPHPTPHSRQATSTMAPLSTEQSFRNNLSQFRWARGVTDDSQHDEQQPAQPSNPFSRFYNAVAGDYVPLRSNERSNEDEAWFALSRWERYVPPPRSVPRTEYGTTADCSGSAYASSEPAYASFLRFSDFLGSQSAPPSLRSHSGSSALAPLLSLAQLTFIAAWQVCSSWSGKSSPYLVRVPTD